MQRGERVDLRYEIIGDAVHGGMGTVYRARDHRSGHDVAVKLIEASEDLARFAREVSLLATVRHPNIVEYIAHGDRYLVMEWVDGETLAARLRGSGIDATEAVAIGRQLAAALATLHAANIVHRDVKPSNVMLIGDRVKLVDFGVARRAVIDGRLTGTGTPVGTAGYMAPEQIRGARDVDARADLFALGCVLYECLTGTPAFGADNAFALRAMVLLHDPPPLRIVAPELPLALDDLVGRLLARAPEDRPTAVETEVALATMGRMPSRRATGTSSGDPTQTSGSKVYAVLVALADDIAPDELARHVGSELQPFDGGAAMACASLDDATRIALALESFGVVAVSRGNSLAEAIERGSRLIVRILVAATVADDHVRGSWLDGEVARDVDPALLGDHHGDRVRLRRPA